MRGRREKRRKSRKRFPNRATSGKKRGRRVTLRRGLERAPLGRQRLILLPHVFSTRRSQVAPSCCSERKERRVQHQVLGSRPSAGEQNLESSNSTQGSESRGGEQQKRTNGASYLPGGTVRSLPGYRRRLIVPPLVLPPPFHLGRLLLLLLSTVRFLHLPGAGCDKASSPPLPTQKKGSTPAFVEKAQFRAVGAKQSEKSVSLASPAACPSSRHPRDELT